MLKVKTNKILKIMYLNLKEGRGEEAVGGEGRGKKKLCMKRYSVGK